jgi:hypothetical protein
MNARYIFVDKVMKRYGFGEILVQPSWFNIFTNHFPRHFSLHYLFKQTIKKCQ